MTYSNKKRTNLFKQKFTKLSMENRACLAKIDMYTHLLTKDGLLFTAREFYPSINRVRAVPCYFSDPAGDRKSRLFKFTFKRSVDEFGDIWVNKLKPKYISKTPNGEKAILVPVDDIIEFLDPFDLPEEIRKELEKSKFYPILQAVNKIGVGEKDIGVFGSYLSGMHNDNSDIDIVIRGINNMKLLKSKMDELRSLLQAKPQLDEVSKAATIKKYNELYNKENDFDKMIDCRWSTIKLDDKRVLKLMFNYKQGEKPQNLVPKHLAKEGMLSGIVVDDTGVAFMPRNFIIENEKGQFTVLTYFYNYYFAVKSGNKVQIKGTLSKDGKSLLIHDRKNHWIKINGS